MSLYPTIISSATDLRPKPKPKGRIGIPDLPWQVGLGPKPPAKSKPPVATTPAPPAPPVLTDAQLAQQQIDPLLKQLTDRINARAQAAGQAIQGYTGSLAHDLAGTDFGAPYARAIPQQASVDASLQQLLAGKGNELAQGLSQRLASIQEPGAVNPAVANVAQFGQGAGTAEYGKGSAELSRMLADQAATNEYGAKQPGIARLAGLQNIGRVQGQALSDIADQTGQLTAKIPDLVNQIQSNRFEQEKFDYGKTQDAATNKARSQQLALENRLANKKYGLEVARAKTTAAQGWQRLTIAQQNTQIRKAVEQANIQLRGESNAIAQQNANTSAYRAQVAAQTAAAAAAKKAHPQMTPGQVAGIAAKAAKDAEDLYHGVSHSNAQGQTIVDSYTQTYQDAVKTLTNRYPTLGRAGVMKLVNSWYKPGEYGRPKAKAKPLSPAQQSATTAALNPVAALTGGR